MVGEDLAELRNGTSTEAAVSAQTELGQAKRDLDTANAELARQQPIVSAARQFAALLSTESPDPSTAENITPV